MTSAPKQVVSRSAKRPPYYYLRPDLRGMPIGVTMLNKARFLQGRARVLLPPDFPSNRVGLPHFDEPPQIRIDPKGRYKPPRDYETFDSFHLVSARMKMVLEAECGGDVEFAPCDVTMRDGSAGPEYWLCDILPIIDAIDEAASILTVKIENGVKYYGLLGSAILFREAEIGSRHLFRPLYAHNAVVCDEHFKRACRVAGIKGLSFKQTDADMKLISSLRS